MVTTAAPPRRQEPTSASPPRRRLDVRDPAAQAFLVLWVGFIAAPILFGVDKFFDVLSTGRSTSRRKSMTSFPATSTR